MHPFIFFSCICPPTVGYMSKFDSVLYAIVPPQQISQRGTILNYSVECTFLMWILHKKTFRTYTQYSYNDVAPSSLSTKKFTSTTAVLPYIIIGDTSAYLLEVVLVASTHIAS